MLTSHTKHASGQGIKLLPTTHPRMTDDEYRAVIVARAVVTESGCWEMPGFQYKLRGVKSHDKGYTALSYHGKAWRAHRLAFFLWKGPIPDGLEVCHRCDNPPCANPDHLFLGTGSENALDRVAKKRDRNRGRTHCIRGHELTGENVRILPTPRGYRRTCIVCEKTVHHKTEKHRQWRREYNKRYQAVRRARKAQTDELNTSTENK